MQASFKIHTGELNESLMKHIKRMFEGKTVTITVTENDDTDYLFSHQANKEHLEKSMTSEPEHTFTAEEFQKHVDNLLSEKRE